MSDPFQKLENKQEDEEFAKEKFPHLTELRDLSDKNFKNDYQNARMLRQNFKVSFFHRQAPKHYFLFFH